MQSNPMLVPWLDYVRNCCKIQTLKAQFVWAMYLHCLSNSTMHKVRLINNHTLYVIDCYIGNMQQCYKLIEEMRVRRILLGPYLDQEMVITVYRHLGIQPATDEEDVIEEEVED